MWPEMVEIENIINSSVRLSIPSLYEPVKYTLHLGGKRLRPLLCILSNQLFSDTSQNALYLASALEIFHNFTLVHDDIMDNASLRRGNQTVYKKWGVNQAILSGDVMLIEAYDVLCKIHKPLLVELLPVFNDICRKVCIGQQFDMDYEKLHNISIPQYIEMIRLKTAVLVGASMQLGGMCSQNCSPETSLKLYEVGEKMGIIFQMQDDYLDTFGNKENFGKQIGGDILCGKKSFVFLNALEKLPENQKNAFIHLYHSNDTDKIKKVMDVFFDLHIQQEIQNIIRTEYEQCLLNFNEIKGKDEVKKHMVSIFNSLIQREK